MQGIEPWTFHMQSERSTTELHPLELIYIIHRRVTNSVQPFFYNVLDKLVALLT